MMGPSFTRQEFLLAMLAREGTLHVPNPPQAMDHYVMIAYVAECDICWMPHVNTWL